MQQKNINNNLSFVFGLIKRFATIGCSFGRSAWLPFYAVFIILTIQIICKEAFIVNLGERIVDLRNRRRISQSELAEALDVSRQSVSKWETNSSVPDLEKLIRLADFFGITLDELVKGQDCRSCGQDSEEPSPASDPQTSFSTYTKAQKLGTGFILAGVVLTILFVLMLGFWGILFAVPFFVFGLICCIAKKHPVLKAVWSVYIICSFYFHYATGMDPEDVFLTFQWSYQMNYAILVFSWIWFIIVMLLILATAAVLSRNIREWNRKNICGLALGISLYLLSFALGFASYKLGMVNFFIYILNVYLRLASVTILTTELFKIIRLMRSKSHRRS